MPSKYMFPNKVNACKTDNTLKGCFVIQDKQRYCFTVLDPWNRGFFRTPDPKRFATFQEAESFMLENDIKGTIVKGWCDPSQGFFPGDFPG